MRYLIILISCLVLFSSKLSAQETKDDLIQFTGMVLDGSDEQLYPIPYTNIYIKDKGRGTYSDFKGFSQVRSGSRTSCVHVCKIFLVSFYKSILELHCIGTTKCSHPTTTGCLPAPAMSESGNRKS